MNCDAKKVFSMILGILLFSTLVFGQANESGALRDQSPCEQAKGVKDALVDKAELYEFNTRRVEISGNTYTRGREFWKRMAPGMSEGDTFTRRALEKSVKRVSKIKSIYPISINNILVSVDPETQSIDFVFCVTQRPKK